MNRLKLFTGGAFALLLLAACAWAGPPGAWGQPTPRPTSPLTVPFMDITAVAQVTLYVDGKPYATAQVGHGKTAILSRGGPKGVSKLPLRSDFDVYVIFPPHGPQHGTPSLEVHGQHGFVKPLEFTGGPQQLEATIRIREHHLDGSPVRVYRLVVDPVKDQLTGKPIPW